VLKVSQEWLETMVRQDPEVRLDPEELWETADQKEMRAPQEKMVLMVIADCLGTRGRKVRKEIGEAKEPRERRVAVVSTDLQVVKVSKAEWDPSVIRGIMARQGHREIRVTQAPRESQAQKDSSACRVQEEARV